MYVEEDATGQAATLTVADTLRQALSDGQIWTPAFHRERSAEKSGVESDGLRISSSELAQIIIDASATGQLELSAPRGVRIENLTIDGLLDLSFAHFGSAIVLRRCCLAAGITISHARLGPTDLSESQFPFLEGTEVSVRGDLTLNALQHTNWIDLHEAHITGRLSLSGSTLNSANQAHEVNDASKGFRKRFDQTLHCYGIKVDSAVWLADGFSAHGEVNFCGATIGRDIICIGARLSNPKGHAFFAAGCQIGFTIALVGVKAQGEVNFVGSVIGGSVLCDGASFGADVNATSPYKSARFTYAALNLLNARIAGQLIIVRQVHRPASLNLGFARVGNYIDDDTAWPEPGHLELDGFVYDILGGFPAAGEDRPETPLDHHSRKDWLGRQALTDVKFRAQPWTQCAKALAETGRTHDAQMILYDRERRWLRSKQQHWITRLFYRYVLGPLSGYGYRSHYALIWAAAVWLMGAGVFNAANSVGMMRPASEHVVLEEEYRHTGKPPPDYEPVNPLLYSADLLLPIVDVGQERYWIPRNPGEGGVPVQDHRSQSERWLGIDWLFRGWLPKAFYYFEIGMGWLLVSIVIAGLSKVIGHAREE